MKQNLNYRDIGRYIRFPLRPRLRLTLHCNRSCEYCFARDTLTAEKSKLEMPLEEVEEILAACKKEGIPAVGWQGGEPLLHTRLEDIAKLHRQYGITAMVFSNAVVPRERIETLEGIATSILINYNPPETYTPEETQLLDENIGLLKSMLKNRGVALGINVTNPEMETGFIARAVSKHQISEARVDLTRPAPSSKNVHTAFFENGKMFRKLKETVTALHQAGADMVHFDCPFPLCQLNQEEREFAWEYFHDGQKYGRCRTSMDISPGQKVTSCFCSIPMKNVRLQEFGGYWETWLYLRSLEDKYRWEHITYDGCRECELHTARVCQGGCLGYKLNDGDLVDERNAAEYIQSSEAQRNRQLATAYRAFYTGRYTDSLNALRNLEKPDPDGEIRFLEALAHACSGDMETAENRFRQALENAPFPAVTGFEAGAVLQAGGALTPAVRIMETTLEMEHPAPRECYRLHHGLAALYKSAGKNETFQNHMREALRLAPKSWKDRLFAANKKQTGEKKTIQTEN